MGLHSGLLSIVGAPGMTTVESLRGKELAVDARASGFVFILEKLLRLNGFGADDYKFVEIGGVDRRYQALVKGRKGDILHFYFFSRSSLRSSTCAQTKLSRHARNPTS